MMLGRALLVLLSASKQAGGLTSNSCSSSRRQWFTGSGAAAAAAAATTTCWGPQRSSALEEVMRSRDLPAQQATNNNRDGLDLDAMIGYRWGGADRCDAADPTCGADGKTLDAPPSLGPAPRIPEAIAVTDVCSLKMTIGKYSAGSLRIGLFGKEAPLTTKIIKQLCNSEYAGIKAAAEGIPAYDDEYYPVSYEFAAATFVERGQRVVISQSDPEYAFCRREGGLRKPPADFRLPPRPTKSLETEMAACLERRGMSAGGGGLFGIGGIGSGGGGGGSGGSGEAASSGSSSADGSRSSSGSGSGSGSGGSGGSGWSAVDASVAGFVSVPRSGLGTDFALTISTGSGKDPQQRRAMERDNVVVGVLLDDESMAVLSRLDSLAVQRAYGKNGYPMLRTVVTEASAVKVPEPPSEKEQPQQPQAAAA
jgi:hypothetical protein